MLNEHSAVCVINACKSSQKDRQVLQVMNIRIDMGAWMGLLGAGGLGVILLELFGSLTYTHTCTVFLILIASVCLVNMVSSWLRWRLV